MSKKKKAKKVVKKTTQILGTIGIVGMGVQTAIVLKGAVTNKLN